jgi:hypothetical protein
MICLVVLCGAFSRCLHRGSTLTVGAQLDLVWCEERELVGTVTLSAVMRTLKDAGVLVVSGGSLSSRLRVQRALYAIRSPLFFHCICVV